MSRLLVIGGASLDVLHVGGRKIPSAGGAGMYTAMAARRCGVSVCLCAPRPVPMPSLLQPVADRLSEWLGPPVPPGELPRFEIAHRGDTTTYLEEQFGAESSFAPDCLPSDLSAYDVVHVIPLGDVHRQLEFVRASRKRGARLLSAGAYLGGVRSAPDVVRRIIEETEVFFMNRGEAEALFGTLASARTKPGKLLFVTQGPEGARIVQGGYATDVRPMAADELDPTGAGDAFCGATLAGLARHHHPVMAARSAVALAAAVVERVGPEALLLGGPPPEVPAATEVVVNQEQVPKVARLLARLDDATAFAFVGPGLPSVGHKEALEFFFATTVQQFGFWSERNGAYGNPMVARLGGEELKGSSYLFAAFWRQLQRDGEFCSPARQAAMSFEELRDAMRADDGSDPLPALDLHLAQARQYGQDLMALDLSPAVMLEKARASSHPLRTLLAQLDHVGGCKEDPLRKKASLLALILSQRPERFLPLGPGEDVAPIIDYHLMRSCLRTGLVDVQDDDLRAALTGRQVVAAGQEWAVRYAAYRALEQVIAASGKRSGAVDWFFFSARQRCPEMSQPACASCPLDAVCAHRVGLFQPVFRTTFY